MITFPFLKKPRLASRQCLLSTVFKQGRSKSLCHFLEISNVSATRKNPYRLKTSCYVYLETTLLCFSTKNKEKLVAFQTRLEATSALRRASKGLRTCPHSVCCPNQVCSGLVALGDPAPPPRSCTVWGLKTVWTVKKSPLKQKAGKELSNTRHYVQ